MSTPRRYLHDRLILLLLSIDGFLVVLTSIVMLLRLDTARAGGYIVQYRSNLGLSAFKTGDSLDLLAFIVFAVTVFIINLIISVKIYPVRRSIAVAALALCLILLIFGLRISFALLDLR